MTTPKSPEQIMEEYRINLNKTAFIHGTAFTPGEAWLRSSMASLLCYMAERMPKKGALCNEEECDSLHEGEPAFFRNQTIDDCRTLLIEEARRILEK